MVVCGSDCKPQAITTPRTKTVTIVGGANANWKSHPPLYVFPWKRWVDQLLEDALPGSSGGMSDSGFANGGLFETYLMCHFAKHARLEGASHKPVLVLYDGHKVHLSLTLADWAKDHNVVLFVLPPHTNHLTQSLDVGYLVH
ncbi:uncharacterized protein LOC127872156 [Dreissena polymorpha]|uniref:uncharacterized protein LOC127872156 n=1 Tax=Dreissena polymorpha TaxID=45954 RepID=UPI002264D727|nr:uncharacterized protein LOC127872156 [Dreissena polymorpha]